MTERRARRLAAQISALQPPFALAVCRPMPPSLDISSQTGAPAHCFRDVLVESPTFSQIGQIQLIWSPCLSQTDTFAPGCIWASQTGAPAHWLRAVLVKTPTFSQIGQIELIWSLLFPKVHIWLIWPLEASGPMKQALQPTVSELFWWNHTVSARLARFS